MSIVQIHVEKTGGITLQRLYEKKFGGSAMALYTIRDGLYAPFGIHTANYTRNWELKIYQFITSHLPAIKKRMIQLRNWRRRRNEIVPSSLEKYAVVLGHITVDQVLQYLPPDKHQYRTVVREPLERMWSHYRYWRAHQGDVGQRVVPRYDPHMTFEQFALLPELANYQTQAIGTNLDIYEVMGTTDNLTDFARRTGLIHHSAQAPILNRLDNKKIPTMSQEFIKKFQQAHAADYALYRHALNANGLPH